MQSNRKSRILDAEKVGQRLDRRDVARRKANFVLE